MSSLNILELKLIERKIKKLVIWGVTKILKCLDKFDHSLVLINLLIAFLASMSAALYLNSN